MLNSSAGSSELWVVQHLGAHRCGVPIVVLAALFVLMSSRSAVSAEVVAEALFKVDTVQPSLLVNVASRFDANEYEIFQKSLLASLKSWYVFSAAIRDPGITTLPILAGQNDPVAWLSDHLETEFLDGSEILAIRLRKTTLTLKT